MAKPLVNSIRDVERNILALDRLSEGTQLEKKLHARLIKNGKLFVVMKNGRKWLFAPSRFAGYKNNGADHDKIRSRDGRVTNVHLSKLLGRYLGPTDPTYAAIDSKYIQFANGFNITPSRHHRARRYWLINERPRAHWTPLLTSSSNPIGDIKEIQRRSNLNPTERKKLIDARLGQGTYRKWLIRHWRSCAVTGCRVRIALRASHIKSWKASTDRERLDPENGLLLLATLDALFDRHLISFTDTGTMLVSKALDRLPSAERKLLALGTGIRRTLTRRQKMYLRAHRKAFRSS